MFTGIIESLGIINNIQKTDLGLVFEIISDLKIFKQVNIGDSVSINGACLTVSDKKNNQSKNLLFFDVVKETLDKTNLGFLKKMEKINLETSLKFGNGLDGHIVQGHVDTTGKIIKNQLIDDNWLLEVKIEKKWMKYCILKGSIAIDGISLTIAQIKDNYDSKYGSIAISIIPHTLENTNLQFKNNDDPVNIETDFFGKYIEKLLKPRLEINE